jgi:site-specific recombinase XerD
VELNSFEKYLDQVCGLSPATRISRRQFVGRFLREQCGDGLIKAGMFTPQSLMKYVSSQARGYKAGTISVMATSIRSYMKFLQFRGDIDSRLVRVVPSPPKWRLADYPTVISEIQVKALTASFDESSPSGIRDCAMAICMIQMGLRASEVADIDLEDIDWRRSTLCLRRGKSRVVRELPLMGSSGKAIARYLKYGRPQTGSRKVFVRHTVPVGAILSTENVRGAMRRAYERAGFPANWTGTHILRHTAATRMLNGGASLKQVADVLGHQSIDTTTIYTKVNMKTLETVMQPWPVIPS